MVSPFPFTWSWFSLKPHFAFSLLLPFLFGVCCHHRLDSFKGRLEAAAPSPAFSAALCTRPGDGRGCWLQTASSTFHFQLIPWLRSWINSFISVFFLIWWWLPLLIIIYSCCFILWSSLCLFLPFLFSLSLFLDGSFPHSYYFVPFSTILLPYIFFSTLYKINKKMKSNVY